MTTGSTFDHHLSDAFLDGLHRLTDAPEGQWWRDVLARRDLIIAVRRDYLNIYFRGASIFRVDRDGAGFLPYTHAKYLSRRQQGLVALRQDNTFGIDTDSSLWRSYEGPKTLDEMIRAAADLAGPEKINLHALLLASPHVVDVEVSLSRAAETDEFDRGDGAVAAAEEEANEVVAAVHPSVQQRQDRLDVATLEERGGTVFVVFHEAKHFTNPELRAGPTNTPPVADQIERYRRTLAEHRHALAKSYRSVCRALVAIDGMRQQSTGGTQAGHNLDPIVARVARSEALPEIDLEPRLVVFGFDQDQRDGKVWGRHRDRLTGEYGIKLAAIGKTATKRSPAFR